MKEDTVSLFDPETEMTSLLGSQDGLAHLALTLVDEGDIVLVQDHVIQSLEMDHYLLGLKLLLCLY